MTAKTATWIECREICKNCPLVTDNTPKESCVHPWRHEIADHLELSGDGTVTSDVPAACARLGATVSRLAINDKRPSVQIYEEEPIDRVGYVKAEVVIPTKSSSWVNQRGTKRVDLETCTDCPLPDMGPSIEHTVVVLRSLMGDASYPSDFTQEEIQERAKEWGTHDEPHSMRSIISAAAKCLSCPIDCVVEYVDLRKNSKDSSPELAL
jgi:hypothetical protein